MKKQNKRTKQKLSKWILPTMPISWLRKLDNDSLNKYAKMYGIKSPKGEPPYTDKELVRELRKFIPSKKIIADYWACVKKGKKKIGKLNRKLTKFKKKDKKQIDSYHKKNRSLYDKCEKQKKKQMDKQIQGK